MNIQMINSGVGGQGILLVARIFAAFALEVRVSYDQLRRPRNEPTRRVSDDASENREFR